MELKDVDPDYVDVPYAFIGAHAILSRDDLEQLLREGEVPPDKCD
jgi:hypothetical protein